MGGGGGWRRPRTEAIIAAPAIIWLYSSAESWLSLTTPPSPAVAAHPA
eukprot:SAG11_NODE_31778_length_289_cov_0.815789_1_plen_47_part_01